LIKPILDLPPCLHEAETDPITLHMTGDALKALMHTKLTNGYPTFTQGLISTVSCSEQLCRAPKGTRVCRNTILSTTAYRDTTALSCIFTAERPKQLHT